MISSNVKVAIIGAGTWGKNHAQIYNAHPFAETVAICDANLSKAQAVAQELGIPKCIRIIMKCWKKAAAMRWRSSRRIISTQR